MKLNKRQRRQQALENQIRRLETRVQTGQQQINQIASARLVLFLLAALVSSVLFFQAGATVWAAITPLLFVPFFLLVVWHRRLETAVNRTRLYCQQKQTHLARLNLAWDALPPALPWLDGSPDHPFVHDLDLLGPRSLHQLLDTAVTEEGSRRLQSWLLETNPDLAAIEQRQALVAELTTAVRFRDRLALQSILATDSSRFSNQKLLDWLANSPDPAQLRPWAIGLSVWAVLNIILFVLAPLAGWPPLFSNLWVPPVWGWPWLLYLVVYMLWLNRNLAANFNETVAIQDKLEALQQLFGFLEGLPHGRWPHLQALLAPFLDKEIRPSVHLRRLRRIIAGIGLQQNPLLGLALNLILPWNYLFFYFTSRAQAQLKEQIPNWLDTWYDLEALNSLANFAWLNPDDTRFPTLSQSDQATLIATQLGHPLVAAEKRVYNNFSTEEIGAVGIITGSNMAGKSTFLRTIGINLVLAYSGGPVMAGQFNSSLWRLFASIRVADSLSDGFSFFYAEVRRLAQLLQALQAPDPRPLFFLVDEIFRGTNNRERLIGSRAYILALAEGAGAGLIATHDLELVQLAQENPKIRNYHFQDDVSNGRMTFDYTLHTGPSTTSNALKIMQLAGLPVTDQ